MSTKDHVVLLNTILKCRGKVLLSGYHSNLYERKLKDWNRHEFSAPNHASSSKSKKGMVEVVWSNF